MKYYEIHAFNEIGYHKLFSYNTWRVAILNYIEELEVDRLVYVEAHSLTDEAFVLLSGHCQLFFADVKDGQVTHVEVVSLEPHLVYRIPKGIYHTHTLSTDAKLLIIEEENTSNENSPRVYLDETSKKLLVKAYKEHINGL
jgi:cupin superfamily acireductone dioxygenase involved in methionine salvage